MEVRHERAMIDDHVGILGRGHVDHRRCRFNLWGSGTFGAVGGERRQDKPIGRTIRQADVCVRGGHPFYAGTDLFCDSRLRMIIEVVGRGSRHVEPAQGDLCICGLRSKGGWSRKLSDRPGSLNRFVVAFRRRVFQYPGIPAIHDIDKALTVNVNTIWKVELTDGLPTIAPLAHEDAIPGKFLNPVVVRVDDIHVAQRIDGHTPWSIKIAGTFAFPSPLREKISTAIKFLNAIVDLIRDVNIARKIHGQPAAIKKGSVEGPFFSPHEQRLAFCRVFLNAIVQCIRDTLLATQLPRDLQTLLV